METYTLYPPGRGPRRPRTGVLGLVLAAAMVGGGYPYGFPGGLPHRPQRPAETEEERAARWAREAAKREKDSAEALTLAHARREKREARKQADRERTARQQGRSL